MSSVQATDFPRFLELPFEIRWTIYELCLPKRVIDGEIHSLGPGPEDIMIREERTALRYIVARSSRTPVTRASPEVYRDLRRHFVDPPDSEWVWSWRGSNEGLTDSKPVIFDPREPNVIWTEVHSTLSKNKDAALAIDQQGITALVMRKKLADQSFLGSKKCIIILNKTTLIKPAEWIASCGLFGLLGEERIVLVDVDDFGRVDCFDRKLNGQGMIDGETSQGYRPVAPGGIRRYSSHSNVDLHTTWNESSPLVSAEERADVIAKDKQEMMRRLKLVWLLVNDPSVVSNVHRYMWHGTFDEENPKVKIWLEKLPAVTFAVRVHAQDLEEGAKVLAEDMARPLRRRRRSICEDFF